MSDNNRGLKTFFTVITAPVWAPVAAAAGLVAAPFKAIADSVEDAEQSNNAAAGIGHLPGNLVGNAITSPLKAVWDVGEMMSGGDKK